MGGEDGEGAGNVGVLSGVGPRLWSLFPPAARITHAQITRVKCVVNTHHLISSTHRARLCAT